MTLSASTWAPVSQMKTDMWSTASTWAVCHELCSSLHRMPWRRRGIIVLSSFELQGQESEYTDQTIHQNLECNRIHFKKWEDKIQTSMGAGNSGGN